MNENDIFISMRDAVRKALAESADEEIEKLKHKFESELGKTKNELVGKILNEIEIRASNELPDGKYVIQINLRKG